MKMRTRWLILSSLALGPLASAQVLAESAVPMFEEPFHRLVYQQANLKVMDILIPPGETTLFHVHDRPTNYVLLSPSILEEQILGGTWLSVNQEPPIAIQLRQVGFAAADKDYIEHPMTHRVRNTGDRELRLIAVNNDGKGSVDEASTGGAEGWTDKDYATRWFRVWRTNMLPSQSGEWKTASRDLLVVNPYEGRLTIRLQESAVPLGPVGEWQLIERGSTFQVTNDGADAVSFVSVEIR